MDKVSSGSSEAIWQSDAAGDDCNTQSMTVLDMIVVTARG